MSEINPKEDGETHINLYSQAETKVGRMLSNFYEAPFEVNGDGKFRSVEGYYFWLLTDPSLEERDKLRELSGYEAKDFGSKVRRKEYKVIREKDSFRKKVLRAVYSKVRNHSKIERRLVNTTLPFKHYYVYDGKVVRPDGLEWWTKGIEKIRDYLRSKVPIREQKGDLFNLKFDECVVAHCVSSDGEMGAGIAKQFSKKYPDIKESVEGFGIGDAAPHLKDGHKIYNLITKEKYFQKPSYSNIRICIRDLKQKVRENGEKNVAIPRIASGLDGKDWNRVWNILRDVFFDTNINILVRYID